SPRISPDGKRVALMLGDDVWIYSTDRRPPIRVTFDSVGTPIWSADGRRLVYEDHTLNGQLRSVLADRIAAPEVASPRGHYHPFGWGPDGGVLAAVLSTTMNVTAERTDGSGTVADTDVVTFAPDEHATARDLVKTASIEGSAGIALSPDGRWLAYTSNITGRGEIWVQPYAGPRRPRAVLCRREPDDVGACSRGADVRVRAAGAAFRASIRAHGDPVVRRRSRRPLSDDQTLGSASWHRADKYRAQLDGAAVTKAYDTSALT